jgi:hypothetical protein
MEAFPTRTTIPAIAAAAERTFLSSSQRIRKIFENATTDDGLESPPVTDGAD